MNPDFLRFARNNERIWMAHNENRLAEFEFKNGDFQPVGFFPKGFFGNPPVVRTTVQQCLKQNFEILRGIQKWKSEKRQDPAGRTELKEHKILLLDRLTKENDYLTYQQLKICLHVLPLLNLTKDDEVLFKKQFDKHAEWPSSIVGNTYQRVFDDPAWRQIDKYKLKALKAAVQGMEKAKPTEFYQRLSVDDFALVHQCSDFVAHTLSARLGAKELAFAAYNKGHPLFDMEEIDLINWITAFFKNYNENNIKHINDRIAAAHVKFKQRVSEEVTRRGGLVYPSLRQLGAAFALLSQEFPDLDLLLEGVDELYKEDLIFYIMLGPEIALNWSATTTQLKQITECPDFNDLMQDPYWRMLDNLNLEEIFSPKESHRLAAVLRVVPRVKQMRNLLEETDFIDFEKDQHWFAKLTEIYDLVWEQKEALTASKKIDIPALLDENEFGRLNLVLLESVRSKILKGCKIKVLSKEERNLFVRCFRYFSLMSCLPSNLQEKTNAHLQLYFSHPNFYFVFPFLKELHDFYVNRAAYIHKSIQNYFILKDLIVADGVMIPNSTQFMLGAQRAFEAFPDLFMHRENAEVGAFAARLVQVILCGEKALMFGYPTSDIVFKIQEALCVHDSQKVSMEPCRTFIEWQLQTIVNEELPPKGSPKVDKHKSVVKNLRYCLMDTVLRPTTILFNGESFPSMTPELFRKMRTDYFDYLMKHSEAVPKIIESNREHAKTLGLSPSFTPDQFKKLLEEAYVDISGGDDKIDLIHAIVKNTTFTKEQLNKLKELYPNQPVAALLRMNCLRLMLVCSQRVHGIEMVHFDRDLKHRIPQEIISRTLNTSVFQGTVANRHFVIGDDLNSIKSAFTYSINIPESESELALNIPMKGNNKGVITLLTFDRILEIDGLVPIEDKQDSVIFTNYTNLLLSPDVAGYAEQIVRALRG